MVAIAILGGVLVTVGIIVVVRVLPDARGRR